MNPIDAIAVEARDLCAALRLLALAAVQRGDPEVEGALRVVTRQAEKIAEAVERHADQEHP